MEVKVSSSEKPLVGLKAIADHLGISVKTLRRWRKIYDPPLPLVKVGRKAYAYPSALKWWITET